MRERYSTQLAVFVGVLILLANALFALVQSPELLGFHEAAAVKSATAVPHPADRGRKCSSCHGARGMNPYPLKHTGWSDESCPQCHDISAAVRLSGDPAPGGPTAGTGKTVKPPALPHLPDEMEDCYGCHGPEGPLPYPDDHTGRLENGCPSCHFRK